MPMIPGNKELYGTKQKATSADNLPIPVTRQIILSYYTFPHPLFAFVP